MPTPYDYGRNTFDPNQFSPEKQGNQGLGGSFTPASAANAAVEQGQNANKTNAFDSLLTHAMTLHGRTGPKPAPPPDRGVRSRKQNVPGYTGDATTTAPMPDAPAQAAPSSGHEAFQRMLQQAMAFHGKQGPGLAAAYDAGVGGSLPGAEAPPQGSWSLPPAEAGVGGSLPPANAPAGGSWSLPPSTGAPGPSLPGAEAPPYGTWTTQPPRAVPPLPPPDSLPPSPSVPTTKRTVLATNSVAGTPTTPPYNPNAPTGIMWHRASDTPVQWNGPAAPSPQTDGESGGSGPSSGPDSYAALLGQAMAMHGSGGATTTKQPPGTPTTPPFNPNAPTSIDIGGANLPSGPVHGYPGMPPNAPGGPPPSTPTQSGGLPPAAPTSVRGYAAASFNPNLPDDPGAPTPTPTPTPTPPDPNLPTPESGLPGVTKPPGTPPPLLSGPPRRASTPPPVGTTPPEDANGAANRWAQTPGLQGLAGRGDIVQEYRNYVVSDEKGRGGMDSIDWLFHVHPELMGSEARGLVGRKGYDTYLYAAPGVPRMQNPTSGSGADQTPYTNTRKQVFQKAPKIGTPPPAPPPPLPPPSDTPPPAPPPPPVPTGDNPDGSKRLIPGETTYTPHPEDPPLSALNQDDGFENYAKLFSPLFRQQQTDLERELRAQGALDGSVNSGGFGDTMARGLSRLSAEQGGQLADYTFKGDQADKERGMQKYIADQDARVRLKQTETEAGMQKYVADLDAETKKFGIQKNDDLQRWLNDPKNDTIQKYGLDKEDLRQRYMAQLQLQGVQYSADASVNAAALHAAAAGAAAQAQFESSKYDADIRERLGLGGFDVDRERNYYNFILGLGALGPDYLKAFLGDVNMPDGSKFVKP